MAYTTLTRYLKLKVDSDLSADAVYNLQRIDALASTFVVDATEKLKIQSKGNIEIEPYDLALGGTGTGGAVEVGTEQHKDINFKAYTASFKVDSGIETKNQATNKTNYLKLAFNSSQTADKILTFDLGAANRTISFETSGVVVTKDEEQTLTHKTFDADSNTLSNVRNANVASDAGIDATKIGGGSVSNAEFSYLDGVTSSIQTQLNGKEPTITGAASTVTSSNLSANKAVQSNASGKLEASSVTTTELGHLSGVTSALQTQLDSKAAKGANSDITSLSGLTTALSVNQGGTGATNKTAALQNLVPDYTAGDADKVLALNSSGNALEWKAAGAGQVVSIQYTSPIYVDDGGSPGDTGSAANPIISLPQADTDTDGYLSSTDWDTFNGKEPAITAGTSGQYWRGDKSWQTLDKSAVGLGNVDNTSDANKPVSSATQTALNAKYDASNPSNFVDAAGAKSAAVVNSTAGNETDQAPSVSAMKSYVTANSGPKFSTTWTVADGNSKTVTHSLGTREVLVTIYDESYETVYVDSETRTDTNTVTLVRVGTATGTWTVVVKKL